MSLALVTGAAHRIGREIALALADAGHDVAVHFATSADAAEMLCDEIRAIGQEAQAFQADLTREAETAALVPHVIEAFGRPLCILVNNASIFEFDTLETATRDSWDRHLESNLRAPFVLTQAMAAQAPDPVMDSRGEPVAQAVVINMIDQRVLKPTPKFMSYTIAKMALWAFTRTAAQGLAPRVRVNAIGPGPTLRGARQTEAHFTAQRSATILQRGADAEDVTAALRYLLTARSVTGQLICTDGGQHLGWHTPDVQGRE